MSAKRVLGDWFVGAAVVCGYFFLIWMLGAPITQERHQAQPQVATTEPSK